MKKYKRLVSAVLAILLFTAVKVPAIAAEDGVIYLPAGCRYGTLHTYTVWDHIAWGGDCMRLLNFARDHIAISDSYGIVTYGDYFCGAMTSLYGAVGDMMLVVSEGNIVYPVIMADTKNPNDSGCNIYGHQGGKCVVEFEILSSCRKQLYGTSGGYISDTLANPVICVINLGSVYDNTYYFRNARQACADNGLFGYTLLDSPYGGAIIENIEEAQSDMRISAPAEDKELHTGDNPFDFFFRLLERIIA